MEESDDIQYLRYDCCTDAITSDYSVAYFKDELAGQMHELRPAQFPRIQVKTWKIFNLENREKQQNLTFKMSKSSRGLPTILG